MHLPVARHLLGGPHRRRAPGTRCGSSFATIPLEQTQCAEAVGAGNVSRLPEGRHVDQGRLRGGQVQALSGKEDQAGGVIWRARDVNNYYVARANALEDNVTIYHTVNGRRT